MRLLTVPEVTFAPTLPMLAKDPPALAMKTVWEVSFVALSFHDSVTLVPETEAVRLEGAVGTFAVGGGAGAGVVPLG